jgi:hypothetical protein
MKKTINSHYLRLDLLLIFLIFLCQHIKADEIGMLWATDNLTKVLHSTRPNKQSGDLLLLTGARNEVVSGQAVFCSSKDLTNVTVSITDLRHQNSQAVIPASMARLQWVRYIDVDRNSEGIPSDELIAQAPTSIPDPFWEQETLQTKANLSQPIWIEIRVPAEAPAGDFEGKLKVICGEQSLELPVAMHVWNFNVPAERHLSIINWWLFPGEGFKHVKSYSDEYWDLLGKFSRFLVAHRQTDLNTNIDLIQSKGDEKDGLSYDTSLLEQYAEIVFDAGIRRVHLNTVGSKTADILDPNSRVIANPHVFEQLTALEKLIHRRKWQNRFLVTISDEPFIHHEETYTQLVDRVHQIAPSVRCIEAVETEYLGNLDIYVPKLNLLDMWYPRYQEVQREGGELWFYTCCQPLGRYPNRFLDQSLLKVRVLHWLNYLYDLKGYLHWGLNQFGTDQPYTQEGISKDLPLGDRAIAYPGQNGLVGSLRFSAQRDGIEDFEYLWSLQSEYEKIKQRLGKEAFWLDPRQRSLELCRRVIWSFHDYTRDPNVLFETRKLVAEEIEALRSLPLLVVQTSPPEGTVIPAGFRLINIRGLASPGDRVMLNGKPVINVRPSGYFLQAYTLPDDQNTVTVTVEHEGKKRSVMRTFKLAQ